MGNEGSSASEDFGFVGVGSSPATVALVSCGDGGVAGTAQSSNAYAYIEYEEINEQTER